MNISPEDAMGVVLSKWLSETTPLMVVCVTGGAMFSLGGFITELTSTAFLVTHKCQDGGKGAEILIDLKAMESIEYHEAHEAKDHLRKDLLLAINGVLAMRYADGHTQCCVYELVI